MDHSYPNYNQCLAHQLPEDQMSPIGLVCRQCKQSLYVHPAPGQRMGYWESQPAAYTLQREPCFVYRLKWPTGEIRSLHPVDSNVDLRGPKLAVK